MLNKHRTTLAAACGLALSACLLGESADRAALAAPAESTATDLQARLEAIEVQSDQLLSAIDYLIDRYASDYRDGNDYRKACRQLREQITATAKPNAKRVEALEQKLAELQRKALSAHPRLTAQPIVFVTRPQYRKDHHNTATMFQTGEINTRSFEGGGAIKTIDFAEGGAVKTLLELPQGVARDLEVHFDGTRILFSMRRNVDDDYHLYEMNADGSELRQLTFGSGLSDIDPIYLPDGRIVFTSTREPKYCMCNRHIMGNLFTMQADGSNVQQIGHSTLHEGHACLLPDGRVLYDRWEYVDRNFGDAQGLWTVNPDGTNHAVYYGNNTNSPGAVLDARPVPGTQQVITTFSSCHDRPWGAIALLDRRRGLDKLPPVVQIWPPEAIERVGRGNYDMFRGMPIKYEDPFPLSERFFLAVRMTGQGDATGICLLDRFGNDVMLHVEAPGCFDPMPLRPRVRPPAIPPRIDLAKNEGHFFVADVYEGSGMAAVPRGTVKWLRVVESPEKRFWTHQRWMGSGTQAPGMAWDDFNNKRILGTVPVEEDGSAHFSVPADRFVYFQLLDERGMMVQSMRSGTIVRPGETTGCIGCHENRRGTAPVTPGLAALQRGPRELKPWYGPPRRFSYLVEVQPALDRNCVECHDYGKPAGKKLNLAGDVGLMFNNSYVELRRKGYVHVVGAGPHQVQPPMSWGSHASKLARVLVEGHGDPEIDRQIDLSREDFDRIVTWIDVNAPYYPRYASAYRDNPFGRSPLVSAQVTRLGELVGMNLHDQKNCNQVSLTRPELSPCLQRLSGPSDPKYDEALAILRAGKQQLAERPRAEMAGFELVSQTELDAEAKYQRRLHAEQQMRRAIVEGRKLTDQQRETVEADAAVVD
jgi:hypothetical protein